MKNTEKMVESLIGGVLFGFTAGIGFILATRVMTKKVVIESRDKSSAPAPAPAPSSNGQNGNGSSGFSGYTGETRNIAPKNNTWSKGGHFDFTTGRYV
tara:strand:+ start:461 stop:754 length:294 start_codon:yes stop_codon:yes gene_type:complete